MKPSNTNLVDTLLQGLYHLRWPETSVAEARQFSTEMLAKQEIRTCDFCKGKQRVFFVSGLTTCSACDGEGWTIGDD